MESEVFDFDTEWSMHLRRLLCGQVRRNSLSEQSVDVTYEFWDERTDDVPFTNADTVATVAFLPSSTPSAIIESASFKSFTYEGNIGSRREIWIDPRLPVSISDYAAMPYMAIASPTVVVFPSMEDMRYFLEDIETAYHIGKFERWLLDPHVSIADQDCMTAAQASKPSVRRFNGSDGRIFSSTSALVASDLPGRRAAIEQIGELLDAASLTRIHIDYYLAAIDVLQGLAKRSLLCQDYRVAGFGAGLCEEQLSVARGLILVSSATGGSFIADVHTGALCAVGEDASKVIELLLFDERISASGAISAALSLDEGRVFEIVDSLILELREGGIILDR